jgi:hypothetical protein
MMVAILLAGVGFIALGLAVLFDLGGCGRWYEATFKVPFPGRVRKSAVFLAPQTRWWGGTGFLVIGVGFTSAALRALM